MYVCTFMYNIQVWGAFNRTLYDQSQFCVYSDVLCPSVYVYVSLLVKGACFLFSCLVFFPSFSLPFQSSIFPPSLPSLPLSLPLLPLFPSLPLSSPLFLSLLPLPPSLLFSSPSTERAREEEKRTNRERRKEQNTAAISLGPVTRTASPVLHPPAPITGFSSRGNRTTPSVSMPRGHPSYLHWKKCTKN